LCSTNKPLPGPELLPCRCQHTAAALLLLYCPMYRRCRWGPDKYGVKFVLETWTRNYKLDKLPIFAAGVSAGASFVLKLPKIVRLNGIVSGGWVVAVVVAASVSVLMVGSCMCACMLLQLLLARVQGPHQPATADSS
jgi:hypothetical protein